MKCHGRIEPGRLTDLAEPIEIRIHSPKKASGVTIKIWELDAFIGADGKPRREGTPDDLLATFTGTIEPAPAGRSGRPPEWRTFKVDSAKIEEAPPEAMRFLLRFPGSDTTYEIPVTSEEGEVEGTDYEIGFSMELGGAEQFRTKVPCLISPATVRPRVKEVLVLGFNEDGEPILDDALQMPPSADVAAIGTAPADFDDTSTDPSSLHVQLDDVEPVQLDSAGFLRREGETTVLHVRKGKKLRVFVGSKDQASSGKVPAALAHPVGDDGTVTIYRVDNAHRRSLFVGGGKAKTEKRDGAAVIVFDGLFEGRTLDVAQAFKGVKK